MAHSHAKPALITDAEQSRHEQLRSRQVRYGVMMGLRALLLIVATVLVMTEVPLLWLWLSICALGMVVLPWAAVLIANDRPAKQRYRLSRFTSKTPAEPETRSLDSTESKIIDIDSPGDTTP